MICSPGACGNIPCNQQQNLQGKQCPFMQSNEEKQEYEQTIMPVLQNEDIHDDDPCAMDNLCSQ